MGGESEEHNEEVGMKEIDQLQEKIHILYIFNLILDKFEMYEEAEFIFNKLKEKEKKLDTILEKRRIK